MTIRQWHLTRGRHLDGGAGRPKTTPAARPAPAADAGWE